MSKGVTAESLFNNLVAISDRPEKPKSGICFEEEQNKPVTDNIRRLFGREKPVHRLLGGGKSADVLLWRNKKISASVLISATFIWVLFEWLEYHFLSLVCLALALGMLVQFLWSNASSILNRSPSKAPRVVLPNELFVDIAISIGTEINRAFGLLQDISCEGNLKQFVVVVTCLWAVAVIGTWCNFLTVTYIGFVAAHTLPVIYERNDEKIDGFVYKLLGQIQRHYGRLDDGVLSRIRKARFKNKKH